MNNWLVHYISMDLEVWQFQMTTVWMLKLVIVFDKYNKKKLSGLDFPDHDIDLSSCFDYSFRLGEKFCGNTLYVKAPIFLNGIFTSNIANANDLMLYVTHCTESSRERRLSGKREL